MLAGSRDTSPKVTDLEYMRRPVQNTDLYLAVFQPRPVLICRATGTLSRGQLEIETYDPSYGSYAQVRPGMTAYVGIASTDDSKGQSRVISVNGTVVKLAGSKELDYRVGDWITVYEEFSMWPVQPNVVIDRDNLTTTFYKDYDLAYTDQNEVFEPIVICGPHHAGFDRTVKFIATGSYVYGSTITDTVWEFLPTGSANIAYFSGTNTSVTFTKAGDYTAYCTVVAANGKRSTAKRHIMILDRPGQGPNVPVLDWTLKEMSGTYDDGWLAKVEIGDNNIKGNPFGVAYSTKAGSNYKFRDNALVVIFGDDYYGGERTSFGNYAGREHIYFVGYVSQAETEYNYSKSKVNYLLKGPALTLKNRPLFSVSLEHSTNPANWTQMLNMSVNRIVYHYLRWHTTLLDIADYVDIITPHGDFYDQFEDIPKNEISNNVGQFLSRVFARFSSNSMGRCFADVDLNMLVTGSRPASFYTFQPNDWVGQPYILERIEKPISDVLMGGVSFDLEESSAYLSRAPGAYPGIGFYGKSDQVDGLILMPSGSQDYVNSMSGLYYAKHNNRFPAFVMNTVNNLKTLDVTPQAYYEYALSETDTVREIETWTPTKRIIPRKITVNYQNSKITQTIEFEPESYGLPGETYIIPTEPENGGGETPPVEIPGSGGGSNTWVVTNDRIGYTTNLTATTPNWKNKTGAVPSGQIGDFVLDPYDPTNVAYCLTATAIYKTRNASDIIPYWQKVLDIQQQFPSSTGGAFARICTTIARAGRIYVMGYVNQSGNNYDQYVWRTSDGGVSWSRSSTGITFLGGFVSAFGFNNGVQNWEFIAFDDGTGEWDGVNGRTQAGSLRVNFNGFASGGKWDLDFTGLNQVVNTGDKLSFYTYKSSGGLEFDFISYYLIYDDDTYDTETHTHIDNGWYDWDVFVSAGNNGKNLKTVSIRLTTTSGNAVYALIDDVQFSGFEYFQSNATFNRAFDCGDHNPDIVYVSDGSQILRSTDGGTTWSVYITTGANDLECYYSSNPTDANIIFWSAAGNFYMTNGISIGSIQRTEAYPGIESRRCGRFVGNAQTVYVVEGNAETTKQVVRTVDGGSNWSVRSSGHGGAEQIGIWPYDSNRVFLLSNSNILYSVDGGVTFGNKNGDWSTVMGTSYSNGIMIVPNWTVTE